MELLQEFRANPVVLEALARELAGRLAWMNRLRFVAGLGLLGIGTVLALWDPGVARIPLPALGLLVLALDAGHAVALRRLALKGSAQGLGWLIRIEFLTDWLLLLALLYWTGGTQSPLLPLFVFHAILAAVLLDRVPGLVQCGLAVLLVSLLAVAEGAGVRAAPIPALLGAFPVPSREATGIRLAFFGVGIFASFHLTHSIARPLWNLAWERLAAREARQAALRRLHVLTGISGTLAADLSLSRVLGALTEAARASQGAPAATLRLLDEDTGRLRLAAQAGSLPEAAGPPEVSPADSPVDREVLAGRTVVLADPGPVPGAFRSLAASGIRSMVGVPVKDRGEVLGVLRVFEAGERDPAPEDVSLLETLAEAGGSAIRNALAYSSLQELEKAKSRYVFHLAHQLKSPLSAVRSTLALLEEGFEGELAGEVRQRLERVRLHATALQALVDNLMALGSLRDPTSHDPPTLVDLAEAAAQGVGAIRAEAQERGLTCRMEAPEVACTAYVSPGDLQAILAQVLDNALKYSRPGGRIRVRVRPEGEEGVILVQDQGIGIPPEEQGALFQEFFRASNARAHAPGTGLGLVLARRLAEANHGVLEVRSPDPEEGRGTLVVLRLPTRKPQESP